MRGGPGVPGAVRPGPRPGDASVTDYNPATGEVGDPLTPEGAASAVAALRRRLAEVGAEQAALRRALDEAEAAVLDAGESFRWVDPEDGTVVYVDAKNAPSRVDVGA